MNINDILEALSFVKYEDFTIGTDTERRRVKKEMKRERSTEAEAIAKLKALGQIRPDFGINVPKSRKRK